MNRRHLAWHGLAPRRNGYRYFIALGIVCIATLSACTAVRFQQRDMASWRRGSYNFAFYHRHSEPYRLGAAIHFAHGKAHDVPELTPLAESDRVDAGYDAEMVHWMHDLPRIEPPMEQWGPHTGQFAWDLYRAIDWTHIHHEQTYDILSDPGIPWEGKAEVTDRAVAYYLDKMDVARSPAPLDVTMRRAGVMMKPYTTYFRSHYPRSNNFFFVAHWWHPAIYEAMMLGGNGPAQDAVVDETHALTYTAVIRDRPLRMLLSRELMPRYSRLSPESANIFDNLHMLHGIAYDILSYEGWTTAEKRAELERVIDAMSEHPGDRALARQFPLPHPDMDPRVYAPWMRTVEGEMNRIMAEMLREMWPGMTPDGAPEPPPAVWDAFWRKMTPGLQPGEHPGSLHDAIMAVHPRMTMDPVSMRPGATPAKMVQAMLDGWRRKYGDLSPVPAMPMEREP